MKIEYMKPEDLTPYERNAKKHPKEQVEQIKESIRQFGFNDPIAIGPDNVVIEGHGRLMAAKELKMAQVPVIRLDQLTEEERKAYMLIHNQLTMNTDWDADLLELELGDITGIDMSVFGLDAADTAEPMEAEEDDYEEPAKLQGKVQAGQIWVLGSHKLMCGDSTKEEDLADLMRGVKADMVFTDPPYGVAIGDKNKFLDSFQRGGRIKENIEGDTLGTEELHDVLLKAFINLRNNCKEDCSYYVSSPQGGEIGLMMMMMKEAGLEVRHNLIWVKNTATFSLGRLDYDYKHEPIFYTWTKKHNFYGGYETTVIDDSEPIDKMTKAELKELVRALKMDKHTSVIYCDKPMKCDLHPTMKPIKLVGRFVVNSSRKGDVVADIFGGSGSTMIACEQLGRSCRMMEKDPHYCDVIIDRWEKFTGRKAEQER